MCVCVCVCVCLSLALFALTGELCSRSQAGLGIEAAELRFISEMVGYFVFLLSEGSLELTQMFSQSYERSSYSSI